MFTYDLIVQFQLSGMIWTVAVVSVMLSVALYQIAQIAENRMAQRKGRK
jgi:hypothetical protein